MNLDTYPRPAPDSAGTGMESIDAGLRLYMLSVYSYMAGGLGVTGLVAIVPVADVQPDRPI